MDLSDWIDRQADFAPHKCAIRFEGRDLSYAALAEAVSRLTTALANELDIEHGDRVAYLGYNSPELIALLFACARIGAVLMPLNWRLAGAEHVYMLNHAEPVALFAEAEFVPHVEAIREDIGPIQLITYGEGSEDRVSYDALMTRSNTAREPQPDVSAEDNALICYTSGTTGMPKGAVLGKNALLWNAVNSTHLHDLTSKDIVLTVLPMFHVGGLNIQTLPALHAGATVVMHRRFHPTAFFESLVRDHVTLTVVVPTVLHALMNDSRWASADLSTLRMMDIGSTIVPEQLVRAMDARGVPLIQVYGSTETAPIAAYMPVDEAVRRPASTGKAALHCEIRLMDAGGADVAVGERGEILVRGPNVMSEYWNDPEATRAAFTDGWFHTGDIGHLDTEGFLYVDGRTRDMIVSGGENIYPAAIENVLAQYRDLAEVAVVGRPDDYWGEVVVAVAVPREGCRVTAEMILAFCDGRIAQFERPREVVLVERLPHNAMGKIVKEKVREMAMQPKAE